MDEQVLPKSLIPVIIRNLDVTPFGKFKKLILQKHIMTINEEKLFKFSKIEISIRDS